MNLWPIMLLLEKRFFIDESAKFPQYCQKSSNLLSQKKAKVKLTKKSRK